MSDQDHSSSVDQRSATDARSFREACPYCAGVCYCDLADVGVGFVQCGPFHCVACGASEIGPADEPRDLTEAEKRTGWYAPGAEPGSTANAIDGNVVSADQMFDAYRGAFHCNPEWHRPGVVANWFKVVRERRARVSGGS